MDITNKRKWQVRLAAILIFLLGFAAGALALNAYRRWGRTGPVSRRETLVSRKLALLRVLPALASAEIAYVVRALCNIGT